MTDSSTATGRRRGVIIAATATVLLLLAGTLTLVFELRGPNEGAQPTNLTEPESLGRERSGNDDGLKQVNKGNASSAFGPVLSGSEPVALDIPSIGVHATNIVGLGLADDGSLEVPSNPDHPGWFTPGPSPGQFGPAVIAGHVDSETGPAVFSELGNLTRGSRIHVSRQDDTTAIFSVDRVAVFEQDQFPTRAVYGNTTNRAELRLITCAGDYFERSGYQSNIVVYAHLLS